NDHVQGEGKLDLSQHLPIGHTHPASGLADRRVDSVDSGERVSNYGKQRVKKERDDGRQAPDAVGSQQRNQKSEQRETRNSLKHVRDREDRLAERTSPRQHYAHPYPHNPPLP